MKNALRYSCYNSIKCRKEFFILVFVIFIFISGCSDSEEPSRQSYQISFEELSNNMYYVYAEDSTYASARILAFIVASEIAYDKGYSAFVILDKIDTILKLSSFNPYGSNSPPLGAFENTTKPDTSLLAARRSFISSDNYTNNVQDKVALPIYETGIGKVIIDEILEIMRKFNRRFRKTIDKMQREKNKVQLAKYNYEFTILLINEQDYEHFDNIFLVSDYYSPYDYKNYKDIKAFITLAKYQGSFIDPRDGRKYKTVKIGVQTWMAENLNYAAAGSKCYNDSSDYCKKYGKLYDWKTAMRACPNGWHLPSEDEWEILIDYVGTENVATKLKEKDSWSENGYGTNDYGFSALPSGGFSDGNFGNAGNYGYWWSTTTTEDDANYAWVREIYYDNEYVYRNNVNKDYLFSVRCVKD
jgi:uncharacterized protein (TIGR02145 family)